MQRPPLFMHRRNAMKPARTVKPLTTTEAAALKAHEATIDAGKETFLAVGSSLLAIQETVLYRETHATFKDYVTERWPGIGANYAYRLITAVKTAEKVQLPTGNKPYPSSHPKSERQLRELAKDPEPAEAWEAAKEETGKEQPTAKEVKAAVEKRKPAAATVAKKSAAPATRRAIFKPFMAAIGAAGRALNDVEKAVGDESTAIRTKLEDALKLAEAWRDDK